MSGEGKKGGALSLLRVVKAFGYSMAGLRHASTHEAAFQQELIVLAVLSAICMLMPFSGLLKVLILLSHLLVLIVELLNTAIESLADRLCTQQDLLIKQAKDMGSAAVLLSCVGSALLWCFAIASI